MIRIDDRTVELTDTEMVAQNEFEGLLDGGRCYIEAGEMIREFFGAPLTDEFLDWLVA